MPKLEIINGQAALTWPDNERITFASIDDAIDALNQLTWALDMNALILEAY